MKKRLCLLLIPLLFTVSCKKENLYEFEKVDNYYCLTKYNGTDTSKLELPKTYKDLPILEIKDEAFMDHKEIEEIIMPDGAYNIIGKKAFANTNLYQCYFSNSLTEIKAFAFYTDESNTNTALKNTSFISSKSTTNLYETNVKIIDKYAFNHTLLEIPENISTFKYNELDINNFKIPQSATVFNLEGISKKLKNNIITYSGTMEEFNKIDIGKYFWSDLTIKCMDGDIQISKNIWEVK